MTAHHRTTVSQEIELDLVVPSGENLAVDAVLRFEAPDPYAVHVCFHAGPEDVVEWTFARQLLTDGIVRPVGDGDVRVWPVDERGPQRRQQVCIALSSPSGTALFEAPLAGIVNFLTQTYSAVPTGSESDFVDLDAELALLMWTGAGD